jgi:hypothetical protein
MIGVIYGPGADTGHRLSRLEYFMMSFPPAQLSTMLHLTNLALIAGSRKVTTNGGVVEVLRSIDTVHSIRIHHS